MPAYEDVLTVPGGGFRPVIFEVMYWLAVVVMSIRSPEEFSRMRVKNMGHRLSEGCFFV